MGLSCGAAYGSASASRARRSASFVEFCSRVRFNGFVRSPFERFVHGAFSNLLPAPSSSACFKHLVQA